MGHVPNIMLVTELSRRGAHPCVTLEKYPTVKAGRNRFLFTAFQPWESLEHLSLKPSLPMRPSTFHALHQATSQNTPKSFPCSYRVLIQLHKLFSSPSGRYQSHHPHTAALLGYGVHGHQPPYNSPEKTQVPRVQVKSRCSKTGSCKKVLCSSESARAGMITAAASPFFLVCATSPPSSL